jgi:Sulfatase
MDAFVGEMMHKLKASGRAANTIVVSTGDHGIPIYCGKTSVYPAGTHGPHYGTGPHDDAIRHKEAQPLPYELQPTSAWPMRQKGEQYDLNADHWAVKNLINDPAHAKTVSKLRKEFAIWRSFTSDTDEPFEALIAGKLAHKP